MAWGGTQIIQFIGKGLWVKSVDFDADTETGTVIDVNDYGFQPTKVNMIVQRTAGSTAGIDVDIQGSVDNSTFAQITNVTAKDTLDNATAVAPYRYFRVYVTTVGVGNTLDIYWSIAE